MTCQGFLRFAFGLSVCVVGIGCEAVDDGLRQEVEWIEFGPLAGTAGPFPEWTMNEIMTSRWMWRLFASKLRDRVDAGEDPASALQQILDGKEHLVHRFYLSGDGRLRVVFDGGKKWCRDLYEAPY